MSRLLRSGLLGILPLAFACQRGTPSTKRSDAHQLGKAHNTVVPERWAGLGLPTQDLDKVRPETNQDRFVADYRGSTIEQLSSRISVSLLAAGFKQTCTQFDGQVLGYSDGVDNLLVKFDLIGPLVALSISNPRAADPMLYGICFQGYQLRATGARAGTATP